MGYPKTVRYHYPAKGLARTGGLKVEPFARFCRMNGVDRDGGIALLDKWVHDGNLRRRDDGGFDVIKFVPRQAGK